MHICGKPSAAIPRIYLAAKGNQAPEGLQSILLRVRVSHAIVQILSGARLRPRPALLCDSLPFFDADYEGTEYIIWLSHDLTQLPVHPLTDLEDPQNTP